MKQQDSDRQEFTYGEVVFPSFLPVLELACKGRDDKVFWDIGCGSAKPVAIAAMSDHFKNVKGIEFLPDLAQLAKNAINNLCQQAKEKGIKTCEVEISQGDLLKCGWQTEADIIYLSSVSIKNSFET